MFTLTEQAARQVAEAARSSNAEGLSLRIAAKYKEDGSIDYGMGFDEPTERDLRSTQHDVEIVIDPESAELLDECVMDFVELEPGRMEFIFMNPADPHYVPPKKGRTTD